MPSKKKGRAAEEVASPYKPRARPTFVTPMAAKLVEQLPEGKEWSYELKFDAYRALLIRDGEQVEIRSRKDKDLTAMYPAIASAGRAGGVLVAKGEVSVKVRAAIRCNPARASPSPRIVGIEPCTTLRHFSGELPTPARHNHRLAQCEEL